MVSSEPARLPSTTRDGEVRLWGTNHTCRAPALCGAPRDKEDFPYPPQYAQRPCGATVTAHVPLRQSRNEAHLPDLRLPAALTFLSGELCAPMSPRRGHSRSHREGDREHCTSPAGGTDEMAGGGMLGRASGRAPPIPPHGWVPSCGSWATSTWMGSGLQSPAKAFLLEGGTSGLRKDSRKCVRMLLIN